MYSSWTVYQYKYLFYNIWSGDSAPRLLIKRTKLSSLTIHSIFNSTQWSLALHTTWQGQKLLTDTHVHRHTDWDVCGLEMSCKSYSLLHCLLCSSKVDKNLLNHADMSLLSDLNPGILPLPFLCLSLRETHAYFKFVNNLLGIVRSLDLESRLFSTESLNLKHCHDISDRIHKNAKQS